MAFRHQDILVNGEAFPRVSELDEELKEPLKEEPELLLTVLPPGIVKVEPSVEKTTSPSRRTFLMTVQFSY